MAEKIAVLGVYPNYSSVEKAVDVLKEAGFRNTDISVLFPEKVVSKDFAQKKGTKAPQGAIAGAGTGAVVGGALGWLVGIGALAIPGLGPFIAAGPLMAALAGVGAGGAVGGITGALIGMGIPEHEAKRYEVRVKEGGILLSVHSDNPQWTKRAKDILERTGAQDISSTGVGGADYVRAPITSAKETSKMAVDLVCGMSVDDNTTYRSTHAGQTFVFCSPICKQEFDKEPGRYVAPARG
jgi:YHS domain-containing protein